MEGFPSPLHPDEPFQNLTVNILILCQLAGGNHYRGKIREHRVPLCNKRLSVKQVSPCKSPQALPSSNPGEGCWTQRVCSEHCSSDQAKAVLQPVRGMIFYFFIYYLSQSHSLSSPWLKQFIHLIQF